MLNSTSAIATSYTCPFCVTTTSTGAGLNASVTGAGANGAQLNLSLGIIPVSGGGTGTTTPSLVAGSNINITGSWPNQTIATIYSGTVTAVSGTGVIGSTGGTTPTIYLSGTVPIALGGTGSATQNFVDLTSTQSIGGAKTFTGAVTHSSTSTFTGAATFNASTYPISFFSGASSGYTGIGYSGGSIAGISGTLFGIDNKGVVSEIYADTSGDFATAGFMREVGAYNVPYDRQATTGTTHFERGSAVMSTNVSGSIYGATVTFAQPYSSATSFVCMNSTNSIPYGAATIPTGSANTVSFQNGSGTAIITAYYICMGT